MSQYIVYSSRGSSGAGGVSTLNGQSGALTLVAGSNITITPGAGTLTIAATSGGSGTVTSVSVVTANGISGSVATATTTPAITLTLGAITPSSVAATGTVTGSNLSGTNTGDQTITLTGDVTGSGTGSFATTIANLAVTNAKIANATIDLTTKVTGILPYANGGTNASTAFTQGSVIFAGASSLAQNNAQFFWDDATARLFMGANASIAGSNAGIQYSDATTANRGQIKLHSYFNGASIAGVSTLTSRSGTVGVNAAVVAGQDYSKWTAQAGATTPGSAPISGTFAFKANTVNSLTVTSDFHIALTNLAGTLGDRLYLSSEGLLQLPGYSTGIAHFDASGNITSSPVSLTADVSGVLPVANGGNNPLTDYYVNNFTLSGTDITNQFVTLSSTPDTATKTVLQVIGGPVQDYGSDFSVSGTTLTFLGDLATGGSAALVAGDKLIVQFN